VSAVSRRSKDGMSEAVPARDPALGMTITTWVHELTSAIQ